MDHRIHAEEKRVHQCRGQALRRSVQHGSDLLAYCKEPKSLTDYQKRHSHVARKNSYPLFSRRLSPVETHLGYSCNLRRRMERSTVFREGSICNNARLNWASYEMLLPGPRSGFIPPLSQRTLPESCLTSI